jgi:hypothetical protein
MMRVMTGRVARCRQRPDRSATPPEAAPGDDASEPAPPPNAAPPEAAPGDDDASEPAPPPSAAPPLGGPPLLDPADGPPLLGRGEGDTTGVCRIGRTDRRSSERMPSSRARSESDGGVAAGPPDAGALVALTGGPAAGAGAEALENAPTFVTSADRRRRAPAHPAQRAQASSASASAPRAHTSSSRASPTPPARTARPTRPIPHPSRRRRRASRAAADSDPQRLIHRSALALSADDRATPQRPSRHPPPPLGASGRAAHLDNLIPAAPQSAISMGTPGSRPPLPSALTPTTPRTGDRPAGEARHLGVHRGMRPGKRGR